MYFGTERVHQALCPIAVRECDVPAEHIHSLSANVMYLRSTYILSPQVWEMWKWENNNGSVFSKPGGV